MKKQLKKFYGLLAMTLVFILALSPLVQGADYADIQGHWAQGYLLKGLEKGWIKGYEDGTLKPDQDISRAEFIALVQRILSLNSFNLTKTTSYQDLDSQAWAKDAIDQAYAAGLLSFTFPGANLNPGQAIQRQEAASLLHQALAVKALVDKGEKLDQASLNELTTILASQGKSKTDPTILSFRDRDKITPRFIFSIDNLTGSKVISGQGDNTFNPQGPLSRAQAMTLLVRGLKEEPIQGQKNLVKTPSPNPASLGEIQVVQENGAFYLQDPSTGQKITWPQSQKGLVEKGDQVYLLNPDGSLKADFYSKDGKTYYVDKEKGRVRGWKNINGSLYYFSPANYRMYRKGMFSTGEGVYWFGPDGKLKTGNRPGGIKGRVIYWAGPTNKELENNWLQGPDQDLRFRGQEIANYAAAFEGIPFKWYGFDLSQNGGVYCVGNAYAAHKAFGITIPGPKDANLRLHKGYELTRVQYQAAEKFGGIRYPADFSKAWPGDLIFNYSPNFYLGYNHVGIYMGMNNNRPIYVHATLKDGLMISDTREMNWNIGRRFNKEFIRYNTRQNKGNGQIPDVPTR